MPLPDEPARLAAGSLPMHAWVDESMIQRGQAGTYLLAAVVADPARCNAMREVLRSLRTGREPKLHWSSETPGRRRKITAAVAALEIPAVVVIGTPLDHRRQERARRCCMETLLPHLATMGVGHVWLEARTHTLNAKDRDHVVGMVGRRLIASTLRVEPLQPSVEPMLWLSDIVAGAVGAARRGEDRYLQPLRPMLTELAADVR